MKFEYSVWETVHKRISVRGYNGRKLSETQKEDILRYAAGLQNPLGPKTRIELIEKSTAADGEKLGTYGIIKGTDLYLGAAVPKHECAPEALGYEVERLVLYLTAQGLGTCWLGGTFNKSAFANAMKVNANELFPIISPIGYPAEQMRLLEKIMASSTKRKHRMDWEKLFFDGNFDTPLGHGSKWDFPLEMVRLAPSAVNKQPWRVVVDENMVHFFEAHSLPAAGVDLQRVDVGIAICHFHLAALEQGMAGHFERIDPNVARGNSIDYIVSWIGE